MPKDKKYKLIRTKKMEIHRRPGWKPQRMYQLVALRDIPLHNVKAGDLGGYVSHGGILSHAGSCWIDEEAQALDSVSISGDAYLGGKALAYNFYGCPFVIKDNSKILDNAEVWLNITEEMENGHHLSSLEVNIKGNTVISGNAQVFNVKEISGFAKISGDTWLDGANLVTGHSEIFGDAKIEEDAKIFGDTKISGASIIGSGTVIRDCVIADTKVASHSEFQGMLITGETFSRRPEVIAAALEAATTGNMEAIEAVNIAAPVKTISAKAQRILAVYNEVTETIASYETDIVKIIKYPVMTDRTNPYTRDMVKCLKEAQYFAEDAESNEFREAVRALEDAYLAAESNALKIAGTELSDEERRKTEKARDLLAIAANDASTENEKAVSFKQAFKQLEGVMVVPETAIDAFRIKIGLKEIEAF